MSICIDGSDNMVVRRPEEGGYETSEQRHLERAIAHRSKEWLFTNQDPCPSMEQASKDRSEFPLRVLLAEDDPDMRGLLVQELSRAGYEVTECGNGVQLLDQLTGLLENRPLSAFDLIISDIRMPGLTGLEILEGLQSNADLPPMILITAFGDEDTHSAARLAGAVVTLDKPFEMAELLDVVRTVLD